MKLQYKTIQGQLRWVRTTSKHVDLISHDQANQIIEGKRRALLCQSN